MKVYLVIIGILVALLIGGAAYVLWPEALTQYPSDLQAPLLDESDINEVTEKTITVGKSTFIYTGSINRDSLPDGHGTARYKEQWASYTGTWKDGAWDGHGLLKYTNNDIYEGEFSNNSFTTGRYTIYPFSGGSDAGSYFEGSFVNGAPYEGSWTNPAGKVFQKVNKGKTIML